MVTVIVDGYNVVHGVPALERQLDASLEAARAGLVSLCRDFRARRGDIRGVCVVFDGSEVEGPGLQADRGGVTVVFTHQGEEADERILEMVRDARGRGEFVIVSNDTHVVNNARGLGARVISAQTFYRRLGRSVHRDPHPPAPTTRRGSQRARRSGSPRNTGSAWNSSPRRTPPEGATEAHEASHLETVLQLVAAANAGQCGGDRPAHRGVRP